MCNIIFAMYDMHINRYGNRKLLAGFMFLWMVPVMQCARAKQINVGKVPTEEIKNRGGVRRRDEWERT